jgi:hypothetical protein
MDIDEAEKGRLKVDSIVAARIPVEVKERGGAVLAGIGATPTQLINAAYLYLLETGRLPEAGRLGGAGAVGGGRGEAERRERTLTAEQADGIRELLSRLSVCEYDYSAGGSRTFKEALAQKRRAEYEEARSI